MKNAQQIFGMQVRTLRKERTWSQEEFADICGLDRTYISGIERGVRNPTLQIMQIIAQALQVKLAVLVAAI